MTDSAVTFSSDGYTLAGTLTLPDRAEPGPVPAVLMLSGSGRTDRDSNVSRPRLRINLFPPLVEPLDAAGFATLRYDKRGVGASAGDRRTIGFHDRLRDAAAAVAWLGSRPEIDPSRIFIVGHSEGALYATRLAAGAAPVAGVVLLAGSAKSGEEILRWQVRQILQTLTGVNRWLLKVLPIDPLKQHRRHLERIKASTGDTVRIQLRKMNAKWMREFMAYDPATDLAAAKVPVLAITGAKELQLDPADLDRMAELVPTEFEGHVVADVTHLLRVEPGQPTLRTYRRQCRQPVDHRVVDHVVTWLNTHAHQPTSRTPSEAA
jgi:pimeloyl-ACP methyl ester carboxylesterase